MVSLDIKSDSKTSSPLGLSFANSKEESSLSFAELLKGAKGSKDDKVVQNGAFVLSLGSEIKDLKLSMNNEILAPLSIEDPLVSLGTHEDKFSKDATSALELNPNVTKNLSITEVKGLISDAKEFLKNKIVDSEGYKRADAKELPKTLKGLVEMAKKFDIDISKITIEEVKVVKKSVELVKKNDIVDASTSKLATKVEEDDKKIIKNVKNNQYDETVIDDDVVDIKVKVQRNKSTKTQNEQELTQEVKTKEAIKDNIKIDDKKVELVKDTKATPLFKAQEKTVLTTEQLVQTKQFKVEDKSKVKTKADETLKLLLRGEKPAMEAGNLTKDFSVATAKVIAPTATTEVNKSLEQLLRGDVEESTSKLDGLSTHKTDAFEVKLNEAKQMIKYLSQDVKTAIEDYKAPFTRVKVQLNPHKMGEVDVTIVQRGKNLHVSISSNTAAINTLAINANELKAQLTTNGINNASLNFNNSSQNSEQQNAHQQQNRQNERKADEEYNYFDQDEQNEEILSSLEIVVPNYA